MRTKLSETAACKKRPAATLSAQPQIILSRADDKIDAGRLLCAIQTLRSASISLTHFPRLGSFTSSAPTRTLFT